MERPLPRRKRTPAEALAALHPEPVLREARIRKPSRRHLPLPIEPEKEVVVRPPVPPEPTDELAQLQKVVHPLQGPIQGNG